jgi:hypothetical protein
MKEILRVISPIDGKITRVDKSQTSGGYNITIMGKDSLRSYIENIQCQESDLKFRIKEDMNKRVEQGQVIAEYSKEDKDEQSFTLEG